MIFERKMKQTGDSGQIGLIVLLVMVVILTLGVSLVSRSSLDVIQSRQEEETSRVFDAAEAGIEDALSQDFAILPGTYSSQIGSIQDISVDYTIDSLQSLEARIDQGHTAAVDLSGSTFGNTLQIEWAKNQSCSNNASAIEVAIFNTFGGVTTVRREGIRPSDAACDRGDNFTLASGSGSDGYLSAHTFSLEAGDALARIKPLYNDSDVRVTGPDWSLPIQYYRIRSQAESEVGSEVRVVEVDRTIPVAPSIFDYVLFSGTSLVK
jgi:type II secretory pathway pseudopilin PulG